MSRSSHIQLRHKLLASGYILGLILLSGCAQPSLPPTQTPVQIINSTNTPAFTATPEPTLTPTAVYEPTATTIPTTSICTPIDQIPLNSLLDILSNPLKMPLPLEDTAHHGVDFAFWSYKDWKTPEGLQLDTALDGVVAGTVTDRFPYGYMIMIETPINQLPMQLIEKLGDISLKQPLDLRNASLTCPAIEAISAQDLSLYTIYAHMEEPATLKPGDTVHCGDPIGKIGNTGDSSNAHLHLEMRVGPSGLRFDQMSHYSGDITETERYNYCAWRISGVYQIIDPLLVLGLK